MLFFFHITIVFVLSKRFFFLKVAENSYKNRYDASSFAAVKNNSIVLLCDSNNIQKELTENSK